MENSIAPDNSQLRRLAAERGLALAEAMARSTRDCRPRATLLAAHPVSLVAVRAAIRAAARAGAPILFAATPSQVNPRGGYAGWTPEGFVSLVRGLAAEAAFTGPIVVGLDLGGSWFEDLQTSRGLSSADAAEAVRQALRAAIVAGYDLLHIRPVPGEGLPLGVSVRVPDVVARTVDLIAFAESVRREAGRAPVAYELSAEGVQRGVADLITFRAILDGLRPALAERGLDGVWPSFVLSPEAGPSGATGFDPAAARRLAEAAEPYRALIKIRHADLVPNPADCPAAGIGAASVGPTLAEAEYDGLQGMWKAEERLDLIGGSDMADVLEAAVAESPHWRRWLQPGEADKPFAQLALFRRAKLARRSCQYVWTHPLVVAERQRLMKNLHTAGIDGEAEIQNRIGAILDKYFNAFHLNGIVQKMEDIAARWPAAPPSA